MARIAPGMFLAVLAAVAAGCDAPDLPRYPTPDSLAANPRAVGIPYGGWIAVRVDGHPAVFQLRPGSSFGDRIAWRWEWAGEPPAGRPPGGSGTTVEQYGSGQLDLAGRRLEWSRGSPGFGWLYWRDDGLEVYSRPFRAAEEARRPDGGRWLRRSDFDG